MRQRGVEPAVVKRLQARPIRRIKQVNGPQPYAGQPLRRQVTPPPPQIRRQIAQDVHQLQTLAEPDALGD